MSYEDFYNKVSAIVKENYSEVNIANKVIATLEQFRLDQEAAQHSVQADSASADAEAYRRLIDRYSTPGIDGNITPSR